MEILSCGEEVDIHQSKICPLGKNKINGDQYFVTYNRQRLKFFSLTENTKKINFLKNYDFELFINPSTVDTGDRVGGNLQWYPRSQILVVYTFSTRIYSFYDFFLQRMKSVRLIDLKNLHQGKEHPFRQLQASVYLNLGKISQKLKLSRIRFLDHSAYQNQKNSLFIANTRLERQEYSVLILKISPQKNFRQVPSGIVSLDPKHSIQQRFVFNDLPDPFSLPKTPENPNQKTPLFFGQNSTTNFLNREENKEGAITHHSVLDQAPIKHSRIDCFVSTTKKHLKVSLLNFKLRKAIRRVSISSEALNRGFWLPKTSSMAFTMLANAVFDMHSDCLTFYASRNIEASWVVSLVSLQIANVFNRGLDGSKMEFRAQTDKLQNLRSTRNSIIPGHPIKSIECLEGMAKLVGVKNGLQGLKSHQDFDKFQGPQYIAPIIKKDEFELNLVPGLPPRRQDAILDEISPKTLKPYKLKRVNFERLDKKIDDFLYWPEASQLLVLTERNLISLDSVTGQIQDKKRFNLFKVGRGEIFTFGNQWLVYRNNSSQEFFKFEESGDEKTSSGLNEVPKSGKEGRDSVGEEKEARDLGKVLKPLFVVDHRGEIEKKFPGYAVVQSNYFYSFCLLEAEDGLQGSSGRPDGRKYFFEVFDLLTNEYSDQRKERLEKAMESGYNMDYQSLEKLFSQKNSENAKSGPDTEKAQKADSEDESVTEGPEFDQELPFHRRFLLKIDPKAQKAVDIKSMKIYLNDKISYPDRVRVFSRGQYFYYEERSGKNMTLTRMGLDMKMRSILVNQMAETSLDKLSYRLFEGGMLIKKSIMQFKGGKFDRLKIVLKKFKEGIDGDFRFKLSQTNSFELDSRSGYCKSLMKIENGLIFMFDRFGVILADFGTLDLVRRVIVQNLVCGSIVSMYPISQSEYFVVNNRFLVKTEFEGNEGKMSAKVIEVLKNEPKSSNKTLKRLGKRFLLIKSQRKESLVGFF